QGVAGNILAVAGTTGRASCLSIDDGIVNIASAVQPTTFLSSDQIRYVPYEHAPGIPTSCNTEALIPLVEAQDESHGTYQLARAFLLGQWVPYFYTPPAFITQFGLLLVRLVDKTTETPLCSQPVPPSNATCSFPKRPVLV